jgi:hypothetical protein
MNENKVMTATEWLKANGYINHIDNYKPDWLAKNYAQYYHKAIDERTAHTVVSTDVEQMAEDYANRNAIEDNNKHWLGLRDGYEAGYAAIQSQSVQPKEDITEYYVSDEIELLAGKWRTTSGIVTATEDGATNADNIWAAGYMCAKEEMQQPTGSVREIADIKVPVDGKWVSIEEFAGSAARNLPVQGIQLSDMFEAMVHGLLISPGYYKCEKKDIDIEHWQKNFDKWVAWYMENRNLPVGNGWTDDDLLECWKASHRYYIRANSPHSCNVGPIDYDEWIDQYKLTHSPVANSRID